MLKLVKSKIELLSYVNQESSIELNKLMGLSKFVIIDKGKVCTPPYKECIDAVSEINNIEKVC